ncbi:hypothetical protein TNCV_334161 [Trichonephila clavipes]|nr:hypothetical protein TNCV_334161 [Trichonephila clavipes]
MLRNKDANLLRGIRNKGFLTTHPNVQEMNHYRSGGLVITLNCRTHIHVFGKGTVRYKDEVLVHEALLFRGAMNLGIILVDDDVKSLRAHMGEEFLERKDIF